MEPSEDQILGEIIMATVHWAYLYDGLFSPAEQQELKTLYEQIPALISEGVSFNARAIELMTKAVIDFSHH